MTAVAVAAALGASLATAGLTGALEDAPPQAQEAPAQQEPPRQEQADPVVTSSAEHPDWAEVAAAVRDSVVAVQVQAAGGAGQGSGVVLDEEGNILTNNHVVSGAERIQVTLADGRQYDAEVRGLDPSTDLAVLTLTDPPEDLSPATFGSSAEVVVGEPVVAVGNPLGLSSTVTTGIVSAVDRPVTTVEQNRDPGQDTPTAATTNAIQVDAAINPGNSGGPLFDATGRVIGITSSIASMRGADGGSSGSIGLGFAIPSDLAGNVAEQLVAEGRVEHAYLGVYTSDGTAEVDGARRAGAQVERVDPGTPAAEAGLREGDVVIALGESEVTGAESLTGFVREHRAGDEVALAVVRDGERVDLTVTLTTRPD